MGVYALTGGASGIGAALSKQLQDAGHSVINVDIKDADVVADLSTPEGRQHACDGVERMAPQGLDGFVPLAGLGAGTGHPATRITALNFFGAVTLVEGLRPLLEKSLVDKPLVDKPLVDKSLVDKPLADKKPASIVLLASNSAPMSAADDPLVEAMLAGDETTALKLSERETGMEYMAGKRALVCWMRRKAFDYGRAGVRMNAVAPGPIETPMVSALFETPGMKDAVDGLLAATPFERLGQPDEVANAIRFLLSDEASYISGTVVFVDGGYDAATRVNHL